MLLILLFTVSVLGSGLVQMPPEMLIKMATFLGSNDTITTLRVCKLFYTELDIYNLKSKIPLQVLSKMYPLKCLLLLPLGEDEQIKALLYDNLAGVGRLLKKEATVPLSFDDRQVCHIVFTVSRIKEANKKNLASITDREWLQRLIARLLQTNSVDELNRLTSFLPMYNLHDSVKGAVWTMIIAKDLPTPVESWNAIREWN